MARAYPFAKTHEAALRPLRNDREASFAATQQQDLTEQERGWVLRALLGDGAICTRCQVGRGRTCDCAVQLSQMPAEPARMYDPARPFKKPTLWQRIKAWFCDPRTFN